MAFVYLAVANFAPLVLVAQSAGTGNFSDIASQLLTSDQLPTADQRVTYKATDKYKFHILVDGGVRYLCLAEKGAKRVFAVLADLRDQFTAQFGALGKQATQGDVANITRLFRPVLAAALTKANASSGSSSSDKIRNVKDGLEKVKNEAMRGIELAMTNTEHINTLESKTEHLSLRSQQFARASAQVSRKMWWASKKFQLLFVALFVLFLVIIWIWYATSN